MKNHGTLLVRVFTTRAQVPLMDATVAVTQKTASGKHSVLSVQVTDESGRTNPIHIPTPPSENSQQPDSGLGFAVCDVWAEHPDYQRLLVEDVQIFPEVETLQDMVLIPLAENAIPRNEFQEFEITPQQL